MNQDRPLNQLGTRHANLGENHGDTGRYNNYSAKYRRDGEYFLSDVVKPLIRNYWAETKFFSNDAKRPVPKGHLDSLGNQPQEVPMDINVKDFAEEGKDVGFQPDDAI